MKFNSATRVTIYAKITKKCAKSYIKMVYVSHNLQFLLFNGNK